jgi:hypothetical protein
MFPMRRLLVLLITTALRVVAATAVAAAADPVPVNNQPFTLPQQTIAPNGKVAGFCPGFTVHVDVVRDTEVATTTRTPPPDKTIVRLVTGTLIERYANVATGKTIVRNVSGDTTTTVAPNGTGTFLGTGSSRLIFGPKGRANTGEPALVVTTGTVAVTFDGSVATGFSLTGEQENLCQTLAGP